MLLKIREYKRKILYSILVLIFLSLFFFFLILYSHFSKSGQDLFLPPTTYSSKPYGIKALFILLNRLGYKVHRSLDNFVSGLPRGRSNVLFVGDFILPLEPEEEDELLEWVEKGNVLFLFSERNWSIVRDRGFYLRSGKKKMAVIKSFPFHSYFRNITSLVLPGRYRLKPVDQAIEGKQKAHACKHTKPSSEEEHEVILRDEEGILLLKLSLKKGAIVFLCTPNLLTNRYISQEDNVLLIANILNSFAPVEGVYFDEYHYGFTRRKNLFYIIPWNIKILILQLCIAVVIYLYFLGKRFGSPRPLPGEARRTTMEYVKSMANIFRRAEARYIIFRFLYFGFKRRLCRYLGLSLDTPLELIAQLSKRKRGVNAEELYNLLIYCEQRLYYKQAPFSEPELFNLSKRLEKWRRRIID